ncbi:hypothetical protein ACFL6M_03525 [Candidatus Eisenbacteria bacterium]|uniref:DUF4013 domain-containing protein n=1 Tax=Eiseniibacteriota bacterium TaxID=2212470 RepID=A0ABV6YJX9_UNCEI
MGVAYRAPLERGLSRMKKALFSPFDIGKWFTIGFTAFLAEIINTHNGGGGGGGGGDGNSPFRGGTHRDWGDLADVPGVVADWTRDNPGWFALAVIGLLVVILITVALTWLSSRGKFMFLYNVARDESKIAKPWGEYRQEGNSLFVWRLLFGLVCLVPIALFVAFGLHMAMAMSHAGPLAAMGVLGIIGLILAGVFLFTVIGFIDLLLDSFVVPIMYKDRLGAVEAWKRFLSLFFRHPGHFVLYALMILVLRFLIVLIIFVVGLFTCCIGFLLLAIPYIGSVVMLPISYTFRAFSLEFLGQFGPEFELFSSRPEEGIAPASP